MNKILAHIIVFSILFCFAFPVFAQVTLPNFIGAKNFCELLTKLAQQLGVLISGLATIAIIISGIMFLFSAGNPQRMGVAKAALTYAIIGLTIGIAATAIVEAIKQMIGANGGSCGT